MHRQLLARTILAVALLPGATAAAVPPGNRLAPGHTPSAEIQGELVELDSDSGRFAAIFLASRRAETRGAAVLMHDQAGNASPVSACGWCHSDGVYSVPTSASSNCQPLSKQVKVDANPAGLGHPVSAAAIGIPG